MKKQILIVGSILALFLTDCKKEKTQPEDTNEIPTPTVPDTINPRSYYPIYPGSYWKYVVNDTDTVTSNASLTYLKNSYIEFKRYETGSTKAITGPSDTVYVPFLDGQPVYGYGKVEHENEYYINGDFFTIWPILSEKVGDEFNRGSTNSKYGDFNEHVEVLKKTINSAGDSIIVLKGHWVWGPNTNNISTQIFIKNIGLASFVIVDTVKPDTLYKKRLID